MTTSIKRVLTAFTLCAAMTCCSTSFGQTDTDTQEFTVTVPNVVDIAAPADRTINHPGNNNPLSFIPGGAPIDHWRVSCNTINGASVSIRTLQAFTHTVDSNYVRDAQLDMSLAYTDVDGVGSPVWSLGVNSDITDYANLDGEAIVTASSSGPGRAQLALTVTFITDTYSTLLAGDYSTTVEGTITANP